MYTYKLIAYVQWHRIYSKKYWLQLSDCDISYLIQKIVCKLYTHLSDVDKLKNEFHARSLYPHVELYKYDVENIEIRSTYFEFLKTCVLFQAFRDNLSAKQFAAVLKKKHHIVYSYFLSFQIYRDNALWFDYDTS